MQTAGLKGSEAAFHVFSFIFLPFVVNGEAWESSSLARPPGGILLMLPNCPHLWCRSQEPGAVLYFNFGFCPISFGKSCFIDGVLIDFYK